jgi:hypothetical protein
MKYVNPIINKGDREFIEVFPLSALSEHARQYAIENYRNRFVEQTSEITTHLQEHFEDILDEAGLPVDDINWSLGYQQGDGVAFYGGIELESLFKKYPELENHIPLCRQLLDIHEDYFPKTFVDELDLKHLFDVSIIKTNNFYHNSGSMSVSINLYFNDIEVRIEEINEEIKGALTPDNEVDMQEWDITHVEDNKWTIENTSFIWSVTIDEENMAQYEDKGMGIPDAVKKVFNKKSNSKSEPRDYPDVYLSATMIENEMDVLEKAIESIIEDTSSQMKEEGYEIYESMITDHAITNQIEENKIRFDIAGNIIHTEIPCIDSTDISCEELNIATIHETMTSGELELFVKQIQNYGKYAFFENYVIWLCNNEYTGSEQTDLLQRAVINYFMFANEI